MVLRGEQLLQAQANQERKEGVSEEICHGASGTDNPTNLAMHASSKIVKVRFVLCMDARRL